MPTLAMSAPAECRSRTASATAMFPPTIVTSGWFLRSVSTIFSTPMLWPCAVSTTSTSTPASTSRRARSIVSLPVLTAAPTSSWPLSSRLAFGWSWRLRMSLSVISPCRCPSESTSGSFSMRCSRISRSASSSEMSAAPVMRFFDIRSATTPVSVGRTPIRSRFVRIPTTLSPWSTGKPEILLPRSCPISSAIERPASSVLGWATTPDSQFFTMRTCSAWATGDMFLWMIPIPPSTAIAIARGASVTVSIAALISGMCSRTRSLRRVSSFTLFGSTSE